MLSMNRGLWRIPAIYLFLWWSWWLPGDGCAQPANSNGMATVFAELDSALAYIKLTSSDLALRTDYVERDSFRLAAVDRVMLNPLSMETVLAAIASEVFDTSESAVPLPDRLIGPVGDLFGHDPLQLTQQHKPLSPAEIDAVWESDMLPRDIKKQHNHLSPGGRVIIAYLLSNALLQPQSYYSLVAPQIHGADSVFLVDTLAELLREDQDAEHFPPAKIDSLQRVSEQIADRTAALSPHIKWRDLPDTLLNTTFTLISAGLASIESEKVAGNDWEPSIGVREVETEYGVFVFGTPGPDHYRGDYRFIYDPGGDDVYDLEPLKNGQHQYIFDLDGNDTYFAREGRSLGTGIFGFGFLFDAAGDDAYRAGNFALGAGFFGGGVLVDLSGNEIYLSDTFGQGAGAFGFGILYDGGGVDQYSSALYAQGFGFAAGVGLLADQTGNDSYFAGGKYKDILRYTDHYISLSQGFSYGMRPDFSGGAGILIDGNGNDVFTCDIFGQGCSYWWAFGGLYDGGGNDTYNCFQYGQGSATHMAAGMLYDIDGNDVYYGKGLMQGCGHDRSTGWILDLAGNDTYTAWDLSQGAGSANGTGLLVDLLGEDRYYVMRTHNTQGYGNPRRDFGSIGIFMDLSGSDRYDGNGDNQLIWNIDSKWGIGVDKNSDTAGTSAK